VEPPAFGACCVSGHDSVACRQFGGWGWGQPPRTTLSRNPRGHSSPPRDDGLGLRRISPEDTGPRRLPHPHPPPPWLGRYQLTRTQRSGDPGALNIVRMVPIWLRRRHTAERVGLGGCPPWTRIFWGASRRQKPSSRGGLEWPRCLRLSVVQGGHPPAPPGDHHPGYPAPTVGQLTGIPTPGVPRLASFRKIGPARYTA
jgi:hypothetical protein